MEEYKEIISLSRGLFNLIGIGLFDLKWQWWRIGIFTVYQLLSILSNYIVADKVLQEGNLNVFSTCIVILSATCLVLVKIIIVMHMYKEFNNCFHWVQECFCETFNPEIDRIWKEIHVQCKNDTLFFTR